MGLRVLKGRGLRDTDNTGAPGVALVNQSLAAWLWGQENPLGKCLYVGLDEQRCSEVVGVIEDAAQTQVGGTMPLQYYLPLAQLQVDSTARMLVVRARRESPEMRQTLIRELIAVDPRIRFADVQSMRERIAPQTRSWTLGATMFTVFGLLALIVASLGLYSVLAFDVTQRTRELGVRAALGATRRNLLRMVVQNGVRVTALGIVVGTLAALALASRVQPLLFGVNARDPWTFIAVGVVLVAVSILAGVVPGSRAARVDPGTALRSN
jgi:ABC-type antimicrobial peptide transport system permease subunit